MKPLLLPLCMALCLTGQVAGAAPSAKDPRESAVRAFLAARSGGSLNASLRIAFADLNGDGAQEALAYVSGPEWCGSGGCHLYVLEARGASYVLRGSLTVTRPPIRVLPTSTKGWSDLGVFVAGGGVKGHEARLRFDGRRYPSNPTLAGWSPGGPGRVLIDRES